MSDRVEVRDGDMRKLPFPDASVDAVVANLAIHNISSREGRREAISEIVRVLKPGGQIALMDFKHVGQYAEDLKGCGVVRRPCLSDHPSGFFRPFESLAAEKN